MLELRRARTISRADRPFIWHCFGLISSRVDHRLNCENHARSQPQPGTSLSIMRYLGVLVQEMADTVTNILSYRRKSLRLGIVLNSRANIAELLIWPGLLDTEFQATFSNLYQSL